MYEQISPGRRSSKFDQSEVGNGDLHGGIGVGAMELHGRRISEVASGCHELLPSITESPLANGQAGQIGGSGGGGGSFKVKAPTVLPAISGEPATNYYKQNNVRISTISSSLLSSSSSSFRKRTWLQRLSYPSFKSQFIDSRY